MPKFQPKVSGQIKAIFGLGRKRKCTDDDLRDLAEDVTNGRIRSLSQLSFAEANAMIMRLGGDPFTTSFQPRRTLNYHRQQAGVKQIAQPIHLKKMNDLAAGRGIGEEGLKNLCTRMLGHSRPLTTDETNKIIEALKAMNARDAKKARSANPQSAIRNPQSAIEIGGGRLMDSTMIFIFFGFILVGFMVGYPLGAMMERRHNNRHFFDGSMTSTPAPVRAALRRQDSILNAEILEDKRHAG